jgi:hypothetical protein
MLGCGCYVGLSNLGHSSTKRQDTSIHKHSATDIPLLAVSWHLTSLRLPSTLACAVSCLIQVLILHTPMYTTTAHIDSDILHLVVEHVFMPPELPQAPPDRRTEGKTNEALCDSLVAAARDFLQSLPPSQRPLWMQMIKMMELARRTAKVPFKKINLWRVLTDMDIGGAYRWPSFPP